MSLVYTINVLMNWGVNIPNIDTVDWGYERVVINLLITIRIKRLVKIVDNIIHYVVIDFLIEV